MSSSQDGDSMNEMICNTQKTQEQIQKLVRYIAAFEMPFAMNHPKLFECRIMLFLEILKMIDDVIIGPFLDQGICLWESAAKFILLEFSNCKTKQKKTYNKHSDKP